MDMTTSKLIETLRACAELLRTGIEAKTGVNPQTAMLMLTAVRACASELEDRWEREGPWPAVLPVRGFCPLIGRRRN
ncbi:hypothetical protein [Enorma phocaeensis]|uniref:Uncharacterized protein n=1 Tax=Enorma phocaeensis TaxID=1871019 RepID=A0A921LTS2_9ACTN|nr:hypothetical protein [Enorma phocaeensis]HJG37744.1 hypothetical protein [Enorma phocaeensis]